MKGAGVSTGISGGAIGAGVGRGASGGLAAARSSGRMSMGASLSPEARFGSSPGKISFSSRVFAESKPSMFNKSVISPKSSSIFNINQGRETKSRFAASNLLRGVRERVPSAPGVSRVSRAGETRPSFSFNINQGKDARSKVARTRSLESKRGVFDMSKKPGVPEIRSSPSIRQAQDRQGRTIFPDRFVNSARSINIPRAEMRNKTVAERTRVVGLNPRHRAERVKGIDAARNTIILWQSKDRRVSRVSRVSRARESLPGLRSTDSSQSRIVSSKAIVRPSVKTEIAKPKTEVRTSVKTLVAERVKAAPGSLAAIGIRQDALDAEKMVATMRLVSPQMTEMQAQRFLVRILAKKYEGKTGVIVLSEVKTEPKTAVVPSVELKAQTALVHEKKVGKKALPTTEVAVKKQEVEAPQLYFAKDGVVNKKRVERVMEIINQLAKIKHEQGELSTGWDVAKEMKTQLDEMSELARPQKVDYRLSKFKSAIANMYGFIDMSYFRGVVNIFADYYSAVKLTFRPNSQTVATGKDAMDVYKAPLQNVNAYVGELRTSGKLTAEGDHVKVTVFKKPTKEMIFQGQPLAA